MNIVFVSNFLNHHQIPLCDALKARSDSFWFIATENGGRQGFQLSQDRDYVIDYNLEKSRVDSLLLSADVVIFGGCPNGMIEMRMAENKLSFLFSERFFKKGVWRRFIPKTAKTVRERVAAYAGKNLYVLCASAFLPYDLSFFHFPADKCIRWGYFPEVKHYENLQSLIDSKKPASLLWVGRFLDWKHPEAAVLVAKRLKAEGLDFELNIIGNGEKEEALRNGIEKYGLKDCVHMLGSMKPDDVRSHMERSEVFLVTSDRREGWGAVLNEAMNSGCAVVASHAIGSVPYLVEDGQNGLIYKSGDLGDLYAKTKWLLTHPSERKNMAQNAYQTMVNEWNAENAATRLAALAKDILGGKEHPATSGSGVCSVADMLRDDWR